MLAAAAALDDLLALLSGPNDTLDQIEHRCKQKFQRDAATGTDAAASSAAARVESSPSAGEAIASRSPYFARLGAARLLDGGDGAELATLRPQQRLAALYILARGGDDGTASTNPAQVALSSPFLDTLLTHLDRTESLLPSTGQAVPPQVVPGVLERRFILELLLPNLRSRQQPLHHHSPRTWTEEAMQTMQVDATALQSGVTNTPLAAALKPIRQMATANQAPAELLQLLRVSIPLPSAAHTAAILGPATFAALQPLFSASSSAPSPSALSLPFTLALPRLPAPAILPPFLEGEAEWMTWDPPEDLVWDVQMIGPGSGASYPPLSPSSSNGSLSLSSPGSTGSAGWLAAMINKAMKSQLLAGEKNQLLTELKSASTSALPPHHPESILATCLSLVPPSKLPALVEKNHDVAREFLLQFISGSTKASAAGTPLPHTLNAYLAPLVEMEMSLHSMELVKDLALIDQVTLPADFLHLYICKCIHSCEKLTDKFLQNRHVRLICVFLQSLIRHKIIHLPFHATAASTPATGAPSAGGSSSSSPAPSDPVSTAGVVSSSSSSHDVRDVLLVEVQSFLVEFSRIKEAAALFKMIKQMEATTT